MKILKTILICGCLLMFALESWKAAAGVYLLFWFADVREQRVTNKKLDPVEIRDLYQMRY